MRKPIDFTRYVQRLVSEDLAEREKTLREMEDLNTLPSVELADYIDDVTFARQALAAVIRKGEIRG